MCRRLSAFKAQVPPPPGAEQDSVGDEAFSADLFLVLVPVHPLGFTNRTLPERQGSVRCAHPSFFLLRPPTMGQAREGRMRRGRQVTGMPSQSSIKKVQMSIRF